MNRPQGRPKGIKTEIQKDTSTKTYLAGFCRKCLRKRAVRWFYKTTNPNLDTNGYLSICKECCDKIYKAHYDRFKDIPKAVYETCRDLDVSYRNEAVDMALKNYQTLIERKALKADFILFGYYKSKLETTLGQNDFITSFRFRDSDNLILDNKSPQEIAMMTKTQDELHQELVTYWGETDGLTTDDYKYLDAEMGRIQASFECPDYGMELIMKDICFLNLEIAKDRKNGGSAQKLIKARTDLMGEAKMKPIQASGVEANETVSFGTMIKKIENEEPIPEYMDDEMKRYIDTYMIGQLARMEGIDNPITDKMMKDFEEYSIDPESLAKTFSEDSDNELEE